MPNHKHQACLRLGYAFFLFAPFSLSYLLLVLCYISYLRWQNAYAFVAIKYSLSHGVHRKHETVEKVLCYGEVRSLCVWYQVICVVDAVFFHNCCVNVSLGENQSRRSPYIILKSHNILRHTSIHLSWVILLLPTYTSYEVKTHTPNHPFLITLIGKNWTFNFDTGNYELPLTIHWNTALNWLFKSVPSSSTLL